MVKGSVLIEIGEDKVSQNVSDAPPVPDEVKSIPTGAAMQSLARLASHSPSRLWQFFWFVTVALMVMVVSTVAWEFAFDWIARNPILGWIFSGMVASLAAILMVVALRELAALLRITRINDVRIAAASALVTEDFSKAHDAVDHLIRLYKSRTDLRWGIERFTELRGDQMDAVGLISLAEVELLARLDQAAEREVEVASRQVATITALVPIALADVLVALTANLRMIRNIAEIYGGLGGFLGSWRLTRKVITHLVATGAVAIGDDMLEPILGVSILGKLSRRFGEGLINGALTARVGVAAIEVCRPINFNDKNKPSMRRLMKQALSGLFAKSDNNNAL